MSTYGRCEICDRAPPQGCRLWMVPHHARALRRLEFAFDATVDWRRAVVYAIATCGDEVCVFRARAHGVPGAVYTGFLP